MSVEIPVTSRYRFAPLLTDEKGNYFFGIRDRVEVRKKADDRYHTVKEGDRVDVLAHRYLGRAELWWVIAEVNDLMFPLELPPAGTLLRIPSRETVEMEILQ